MLLGTMGLVFLLCAVGLICWSEWATSTPAGVHTDDCLAWRDNGDRDIRCTAPHGTGWFGPRAEADLIQTFDHQIGFRHD
jgi:hypothetical protein